MSFFGALTTADAGLTAQQAAIGNISQNVANSQTIGYKGIGTSFEELVTESNQNYNAPGGVIASPVYQNNIAGTLEQSQTATNLAISGNGFFAVAAPTSSGTTPAPNTNTTYYTRRGDFQLDQNDYFVNGSGYYLQGYQINQTTGTTDTSALVPIQVSQLINQPVATSTVKLAANLPAGASASSTYSPTTVSVYDALGVAHTLSVTFAPVTTGTPATAVPNEWTADISAAGIQGTAGTYQLTLKFSDGTNTVGGKIVPAGSLYSITDSSAAGGPDTAAPLSIASATSGSAASVTIPFTNSSGVVQNLALNLGTYGGSSGLTQYSGTSVSVQSLTQDGAAQGTFSNVSVDDNGFVSVNYSNGQSIKYFQIPLTQFNASQDLQTLSGQTYQQTSTSGLPITSVAGQNGAGTITPSAVEGSNVDIASQFTNLIVAQEAYTANTKVVSTANQLITALLQIVS